jgi:hypothetical protein
MYALFLDSDGIVAHIAVPKRGHFTVKMFLVNHYITKNLRSGMRRIKLLHVYLEEQRIEILIHPLRVLTFLLVTFS